MPKIGLDDYLLTHTLDEFLALPVVTPEDLEAEMEPLYQEWLAKHALKEDTPNIGAFKCTDMGNAERLHLREDGQIKWSEDGGWRIWDGKRWDIDRELKIMAKAAKTVRQIYAESAQSADEDRRKALAAWAVKSESAGRINAMIELCRPIEAVSPNSWDKDIWLINMRNGTLNYLTGEFYEHRKNDCITKLIDIDYNTEAVCPLWEKFLTRIIPNNDDRRFLQKAIGYSLTGSIREQCFFLLYGEGQNGKSTFLKTIRALMQDYADVARTETLMQKKFDQIPQDIAALRGLRFVYAVETESGRRLSTSLIKQMTGGEELRARFLYGRDFSFTPTHKVWLGANHEPRVIDTDLGFWRRVRKIPFTQKITGDEDDKELGGKLLEELPGILQWAVTGLKIYLAQGLLETDNIKEATQRYRDESDILRDFFDECCTITNDPDDSITKADMLEKYEQWAKRTGEKLMSPKFFVQRLREKGLGEDKSHGIRYWTGIKSASETLSQPQPPKQEDLL